MQTAGRDALGDFAPDFAHYNDDILFGENRNNEYIDLKTRSIITHAAFYAGWPRGRAVFNLAKEVWPEEPADV